jgi:hypothetical protein
MGQGSGSHPPRPLGENAISSIDSMYAMGKVRMAASEFCAGEGSSNNSKVVNGRDKGGRAGALAPPKCLKIFFFIFRYLKKEKKKLH